MRGLRTVIWEEAKGLAALSEQAPGLAVSL